MKVPYTYLEVEAIESIYDEQVPLKFIAENVNRDFHNNKNIRNENSVKYVIRRLYSENGDEWLNKLEDEWLRNIK